jgi:hypothetical protein
MNQDDHVINLAKAKELYAYSYRAYYFEMKSQGYFSAKIGDAIDTERRWLDPDSSGANEGQAKTKIAIWQDLENFKRDYDIRNALRYHFPPHPTLNGKGTEWHTLYPPKNIVEKFSKEQDFDSVNQWVKKEIEDKILLPLSNTNNLLSFKPRAHQDRIKNELIDAIKNKNTFAFNVMQNICPRGGKTTQNIDQFLSFGELFNCKLMLVPMYVLGVMPSLKRDAGKFKQFSNIVVLDTNIDNNVEITAKAALDAGKQVIIGVSLHHSSVWYQKHTWIHEYTGNTYVVVDEADFGAHTDNSMNLYKYLIANKTCCVNVTSGTNAKRMARILGVNIDLVQNVEYSELENSNDPSIVKRKFVRMTLPTALQEWANDYDPMLRVNWAKIHSKPIQNQQFITKFLRGIFSYEPEWGNSIEQIAGKEIDVCRLKISATKSATEEYVRLANSCCSDHLFVALNGDYTNNREAEEFAEQIIREVDLGFHFPKKKIVFVVQQMGSRSWSVGKVEASIQCIDAGDLDIFKQEASRAITPFKDKTQGFIIDCGFDPNRISHVEAIIMTEASSLAKTFDQSIPKSLRYMFNNISLTNCDEFGFNFISADDLLDSWEDENKILEIADGACDIASIISDPTALEILLRCKTVSEKDKKSLQTLLNKAKTYGTKGNTFGTKSTDKDAVKFKKQVLGAIRSINSSATTVYDFADGGESFLDCLSLINSNYEIDKNFLEMYNINSKDVIYLLSKGHLPVALLDICVNNSKRL